MKSIGYKGTNVFYNDQGEGDTVVFLHGFTENSSIWNNYTDRLKLAYRIISVDLLGHGKSGNVGDVNSMDDQAEAVYQILMENEIESCVCVGHSMGGYVTLALAEIDPDLLKGFCLFHSTAYPDSEEKKADRKRSIPIVRSNKSKYIGELTPKLFANPQDPKLKSAVDKIVEMGLNTTEDGICAALLGMSERPDRVYVLEEAEAPVLFIAGMKDGVIPFEKIKEQAEIPTIVSTLYLENAAHMGFIEAEEDCFEAISDFLELCFS